MVTNGKNKRYLVTSSGANGLFGKNNGSMSNQDIVEDRDKWIKN